MSATFGNTKHETSHGQYWGQMLGSYFFCPEKGVADSITVLTRDWAMPAKCGIYRKSDGAFIAETEEKSLPVEHAWTTFNFISKPELVNEEYWLVVFSAGQPIFCFSATKNPVKLGRKKWTTSPYPVFPFVCPVDAFSDKVVCIYCTYTPLGVPPEGPIITVATMEGGVTDPVGQYIYAVGSVATVVAIPDYGYGFDHWEIDGVQRTENPIGVLMDSDHVVTAFFTYLGPQEGIAQLAEVDFPAARSPGSFITGYIRIENVGIYPDNFQLRFRPEWGVPGFITQKELEPKQSLEIPITSFHGIIMPSVDAVITLEASHYELDRFVVDDVATVTILPEVASINGHVKDTETLNPISAALIECNSLTTRTDELGYYEFTELPLAFYAISASATGYIKKTKTIDVVTPETYTADFELDKEVLPSPTGKLIVTGIGVASTVALAFVMALKLKK